MSLWDLGMVEANTGVLVHICVPGPGGVGGQHKCPGAQLCPCTRRQPLPSSLHQEAASTLHTLLALWGTEAFVVSRKQAQFRQAPAVLGGTSTVEGFTR